MLISLDERRGIKVGSLGVINFEPGLYAYVGSAQGGLEQRILRHLGGRRRAFWHIDYLLGDRLAKIVDVFFKAASKNEECYLAKVIGELGEPIVGFGSSDCGCKSHLFRVDDRERFKALLKGMGLNSMKEEMIY